MGRAAYLGFYGPDITSPISEISTALCDLEGLPAAERQNPLAQIRIGYLRAVLKKREAEEERAEMIPAN